MLLTAQLSLSDKKPPYFFLKKFTFIVLVCAHNIHGMATLWRSDDNLRPRDGTQVLRLGSRCLFSFH